MPDALHAALADIGGGAFAAAAAGVWPVAIAINESAASREAGDQRFAWIAAARRDFSAAARLRGDARAKAMQRAVVYLQALPDDLRLALLARLPQRYGAFLMRPAAVGVSAAEVARSAPRAWTLALDEVRWDGVVARPNSKGPMPISAEVARHVLPLLDAAGIAPSAYERSAAVRALGLFGNAAAEACGREACGTRHWRDALRKALNGRREK